MSNDSAQPWLPTDPSRENSHEEMPPKRHQVRYVSEDDGEGNWLLSYADMMTLLFSFFVVLSVLSKPDNDKLERLRIVTAESMGVPYENSYEKLFLALKNVLHEKKLDEEIQIKVNFAGVIIISKGTLFFESASSELTPKAKEIVERVAEILKRESAGYTVVVEGHTDDVPIVTARFPSNWELSSSRAGTVVRMLEEAGLPHTDLRPVGLADTEPVKPNRDLAGLAIAENQAMNRRVVIRIQRKVTH